MYSYGERIGFSRAGEDDRLRLGGLVDYFQDSSNYQSEDLGVGVETLMKEDSCWILLSWQIVIEELPMSGNKVVMKTWPHSFKGFLGNRNYAMEAEDGKVLAYANAIWTFADIQTGKPKKVPAEVIDTYPMGEPYRMEYAPRKIKLPEEMEFLGSQKIGRSMIDTNHHVNNSKYVHLAEDYLPEDKIVKQLRVEYRQAAYLGETLQVYGADTEDGFYIALKGEDGEVKTALEFKTHSK